MSLMPLRLGLPPWRVGGYRNPHPGQSALARNKDFAQIERPLCGANAYGMSIYDEDDSQLEEGMLPEETEEDELGTNKGEEGDADEMM